MKPGKILSFGIMAAMLVACDSATTTPAGQADGNKIGPAVNAVAKVGALQAGYGISREAAADSGFDFKAFDNQEFQNQLREIGICENFIDLIGELANLSPTQNTTPPKLAKVISCMTTESQNLAENADGEALFPVLDKCFCDGSGTVFGAIAAYAWNGKYKSPQLTTYKAPATGSFKTPNTGTYKSPTLQGYKSPSL